MLFNHININFTKKTNMKLKLSKSIFLFSLMLANFLSAQRIEWSPVYKGSRFGSFVYADKGKDFYTLTLSGSILLNNRFLTRYEDFSKGEAKKISYKVDGGTGSFNDMIIVDGKVVVFITDRKNGMYKLYYQVYDKKCMPATKPELVIEYKSPKGFKRGDYFNIIQSKNKKYFVVEYAVPGNKSENDRYGYKIFDDSFEMVGEGEYESPYGTKESDIANRYISNSGDLFVGIKVYNTNSKGRVRDFSSLKKYIVCFIKGDDLEEMDLDFKKKTVTDLSFSSDDNRILTCTGLYGEDRVATKGAFYCQMDFKKKTIINEGFSEFKKDFITQGWSDRAKKRANKRESKGKGTPQLYSYDFREVHTTKDGGIIVAMEQYYVVVVTTTDSKGNTRTTYHYYYNDVIVYRVQENGTFDWIKKVPKYQHTVNDGGYISSIGGYFTDDTYIFYFNDNKKNYSSAGKFLTNLPNIYSMTASKRNNCVARVEVDLENGNLVRDLYLSRKEAKVVAVPKRFVTDYVNNEMFMFFRISGFNKKEKFGLLKF